MSYTITNVAGYTLDLGDRQLANNGTATVEYLTNKMSQYRSAGLLSVSADASPFLVGSTGGAKDVRDYGVKGDWKTSLGLALANGTKAATNSVTAFTPADAGKVLIANIDSSSNKFVTTIVSVAGGVATLADNAPGDCNTRVRWGTDDTVALQAAFDQAAAAKLTLVVPQLFIRVTKLDVPVGLKVQFGGWGASYGPYGVNPAAIPLAGCVIQQLPGAERDLIRFKTAFTDGGGRRWVGPFDLAGGVELEGPERNVIDKNGAVGFTTGSGVAMRASEDGSAATPEDGSFMSKVQATAFPQDGFVFPSGAVPMIPRDLRAYFNGRYGASVDGSAVAIQGFQLDAFTGDGNSDGLLYVSGLQAGSALRVNNLKSEKADYYPGRNGGKQESAVILDNCNSASEVVIDGVSHVSSVPAGAATEAPGAAIKVTGTGNPRVFWNGVSVPNRGTYATVLGGGAYASTALKVLDHPGQGYSVPFDQPHGFYDLSTDAPFMWYKGTDGFLHLELGSSATTAITRLRGRVDLGTQRLGITFDTTISVYDWLVGITSTGAPRAITMPVAANAKPGRIQWVVDEGGNASVNNITLTCQGTDTFTDGSTSKKIRTNGGAIGFYSNGNNKFAVIYHTAAVANDDLLYAGEETMSRRLVSNGGVAQGNQALRLAYFTAKKSETITQVKLATSSTAAAATPTLIRVGIYTVAANGDLTLVASTPSDTTLLAAASTAYAKALSAALAKVDGQRYAVGVLVVTGAAAPTIQGASGGDAYAQSGSLGNGQRISGLVAGQADLPSTITAATVTNSASTPYVELLP
jgi:hypothetical protein